MPLLGEQVKIVLMAGGRGERFWPRSTKGLPKQFLKIDGDKSLLRRTYERAAACVNPRAIYVITGAEHVALARQELPELPVENLILEPVGRNTAPALGLAALWLERMGEPATMVALPSDHHIVGERKFQAALHTAVAAAEEGYLVTLGIAPTRPETGYGYIHVGPSLHQFAELPVHRVLGFTEKPDLETANEYLRTGDYLWNSGMVVTKVATLQGEIARFLPKVHELFREIGASAATLADLSERVGARFGEMPAVSIDYGVLERSDRLVTAPAQFGWNDIGDWAALGRVLPRDERGNAVRGDALLHDCSSMTIDADADRLVVAVGAHDLVVVDTAHAVLVCGKENAQEVRRVAGLASSLVEAFQRAGAPEGTEVTKPWGREICWANTPYYAAKVIDLKAGHAISWQHQEGRHETVYVESGTGRLLGGHEGHEVRPGRVFTLPPGTVYRLEAASPIRLIEVSTPELTDANRSERVEPS